MMLGYGTHKKIVVSTLCEIRGALPLVEEGILDEVSERHQHLSSSIDKNSVSMAYPYTPALFPL